MRQGLCLLLNGDGRIKIVGEARNGREAVKLAQRLRPDVILMDIAMPVLNGLEATRQIIAANPTAKILILSVQSEDAYVQSTREMGASGFVTKQDSAEILATAIVEIAKGNTYFGPDRAGRQQKAHGGRLSARETEVLRLVAEGSSSKQAAVALGLSLKTVEKHRQKLMDKLNIHETAGLTRYAIGIGTIGCKVELKIV